MTTHTCTAQSKLNYRYFSDTAAPTGDTERQTQIGSIISLEWVVGGRVKRTDTIRLQTSKGEEKWLGDTYR